MDYLSQGGSLLTDEVSHTIPALWLGGSLQIVNGEFYIFALLLIVFEISSAFSMEYETYDRLAKGITMAKRGCGLLLTDLQN